ncbi:hypothetical protein CA54_25470 [Symmachiella macrocystis]|uniref:DUF962 domain-containing protein n=1 Tax=Symmachiella macrocystis TaxID=2527985 RepID=A0A5C6BPU3_9PLAN|nr:Mpo1-like protein [Symmachiella macrocystis]TWU13712.1 hypothetical protein CA54_25470 [Symmachiella macrocystis]
MPKKSADEWFTEYAVCHQNATNKTLHWICIPLIVLSLIGLLWGVALPGTASMNSPYWNWGMLLIVISLLFYLRLSLMLAAGMLLVSAAAVGVLVAYQRTGLGPVWVASLVVFVVAWIGQFIGHKIEGKKPAFFEDIQYLLIGPIWLLAFIYRRLGIRY